MDFFKIGFVGAGRITRVMVAGWVRSGGFVGQVFVQDPELSKGAEVVSLAPDLVAVAENLEALKGCDVIFLAVHPPVLRKVLEDLGPLVKAETLVVSLAPKVTLGEIHRALGGHGPLARVNPSAPGIVGKGLNPHCFSGDTPPESRLMLTGLLSLLGDARIVDEPKLEAYALVGAMGPTYFWFQWVALQDLAVSFGMAPDEAALAVEAMVTGAVGTLYHSGLTPETVMDLVPVKPLGDQESLIRNLYADRLNALFLKIKPQGVAQ